MSETSKEDDSMDINSNQFDSETFVNSLILKKGLDELVTVEGNFNVLYCFTL